MWLWLGECVYLKECPLSGHSLEAQMPIEGLGRGEQTHALLHVAPLTPGLHHWPDTEKMIQTYEEDSNLNNSHLVPTSTTSQWPSV